jgi:two-component system alkaline phosphatase synthesis response regulator PhoP
MSGKQILLIEDDENVIKSVVYSLEKAGYIVESTVSGRLGLETALKSHPDLIIADLLLPDMFGADMLAQLRQDDWGKNAKVIVLTNLDEAQIKAKLASLNIEQYLVKVENTLSQIQEVVDQTLK